MRLAPLANNPLLLPPTQGLSSLPSLNILDVSSNRISEVDGLEAQGKLEDLWLNDNQVGAGQAGGPLAE